MNKHERDDAKSGYVTDFIPATRETNISVDLSLKGGDATGVGIYKEADSDKQLNVH